MVQIALATDLGFKIELLPPPSHLDRDCDSPHLAPFFSFHGDLCLGALDPKPIVGFGASIVCRKNALFFRKLEVINFCDALAIGSHTSTLPKVGWS